MMQLVKTEYDPALLNKWKGEINEAKITGLLMEFVSQFDEVIGIKNQREHFKNYLIGLTSSLERKSIEPIALRVVGAQGVRPMQQFMVRSTIDDSKIKGRYQELMSASISSGNGMLSVDSSENAKKGKHSAGVGRQYCGRLGKIENCQSGVFLAYSGENGYALVDGELYLQEKWFSDEYADRRDECNIPEDKEFQTKNKIALSMINDTFSKNQLDVKWIGCDSAFGSDHSFLDSLPKFALYFAAVKTDELIFLPKFDTPVKIKTLAQNDDYPWNKQLFDGAKGASYSDVKIIRAFANRTIDGVKTPSAEIWVYIRKYKNGDLKFFISNAPKGIGENELHEAVTLRWPIEQCFEECKTSLGMSHYEGRSYNGLLRHWLFVTIAHFFATSLRLALKKPCH